MIEQLVSHETCDLFERCSSPRAPLCPLREESLSQGVWYTDQDVCSSPRFSRLGWVKKQRQIAELNLSREDGYFTIPMLTGLKRVINGLKGANPKEVDAESRWLEGTRHIGANLPGKTRSRTKHTAVEPEIGSRLF